MSPLSLLHVFPTFAVGGAQVRFVRLVRLWGARFRHTVIALDGRTAAGALLPEEAPVAIAPPPSASGSLPLRLWRIARRLRAAAPDVLLTYNWGAIEWALANRLVGRPHLHLEDGFGPDEADRQIPRRVLTRRVALARSRGVILASRNLEAIAREIWRLDPRSLHYAANGIDLARFAPRPGAAARAALGLPPEALVVGWVGALRPEKNLARLLAAFARIEGPAHLVLIGDGPEATRVRDEAARQGLAARVHLPGGRADVAPLLSAFDVFALSSDTEQTPLVLLEAMAAGLPVAATAVGDVALLVADENRPFVTPRETAALGEALARLAADPALRRRLGAANRAKACAEFAEERMAAVHAALIAAAAGRD